jgi:BirA family biotin operon repressor/biotin-[acetyl-CoA-carboxylase] ligase
VSIGPRLPQGYVVHAFDRVESTNDEARRLAEQGAAAGAVVVAAEQVKGRGRLVRGAKVAGLLLESASGSHERVAWVVVGSGVNIASAPADTPYPATALRYEGFPPVTPVHLLERYLGALDVWLDRWRIGRFAAVRAAWLTLGSGIGDRVRLRLGREEVAGRFLDVTEQGALLVAQDGDRRRQIAAGELLFSER